MALVRTSVGRIFRNTCILNHSYAVPKQTLYNKFSGLSPNIASKPTPVLKVWHRGIRSGSRRSLTPVDEIAARSVGLRDLVKPLGFTVLVSGLSFTGTAIWQYETLRKVVGDYRHGVRSQTQRFFGKAGSFRHHVNLWWNSQTAGHKLVVGLMALNVGVYLLWRVPAMRPIMLNYFSSSPMSGAPSMSLLLSTFSHYSMFHLAANMYVLWSFTDSVCSLLGREQFLGVYLTAGVVSGFASHLLKVVRASAVPSLGASGAIMAVLGIVCCQYPSAQLSIAFVGDIFPHSFSASSAVKALIAFDTLGVLLRWRFFDHAAHLGGMLFGIWYIKYGHKYIWGGREPLMRWWHKLRGKP